MTERAVQPDHRAIDRADEGPQPYHGAFVMVFAAVALVFLSAFALVVPVGFGLDEEHHTYRAWQVSRGTLSPDTLTPGKQYGGAIPTPLVAYVIAGTDAANAARGTGSPWDRDDVTLAPDLGTLGAVHLSADTPTQLEEFTNAGASTFVPYLPAALGMRLATAAGLDVAGIVLSGKLANALVYAAMTSLAMLSLRRSRWRWLAAIIALLPLSVFQAAVLTADTVSNALAILFVSVTLATLRSRSRAHPLWLAVLAVSALGLIAAKPTYALMLPLLLTLPSVSLGMRRAAAWVTKIGALAAFAAVTLVVAKGSSAIAGAIRYQVPDADAIDQSLQLGRLLLAPLEAVKVVARTFIEFGASWVEGSLTMFGTNIVFAPQPVAVTLIAILLLAALRGDHESAWRGAVFIAVATVSYAAVIGALYLTFSPVGAPYASGVQGRYWIPLFLPLLAGLGMSLPIRAEMSERVAAITFTSVIVCALSLSLIVWIWTVS
ncbi:DUF2142 domain-containing protein [Microbacterium aurum]